MKRKTFRISSAFLGAANQGIDISKVIVVGKCRNTHQKDKACNSEISTSFRLMMGGRAGCWAGCFDLESQKQCSNYNHIDEGDNLTEHVEICY